MTVAVMLLEVMSIKLLEVVVSVGIIAHLVEEETIVIPERPIGHPGTTIATTEAAIAMMLAGRMETLAAGQLTEHPMVRHVVVRNDRTRGIYNNSSVT